MADFPKKSLADWQKLASQELKGADPATLSTFTKPLAMASPSEARMPETWWKPPGERETSGRARTTGFAGSPE